MLPPHCQIRIWSVLRPQNQEEPGVTGQNILLPIVIEQKVAELTLVFMAVWCYGFGNGRFGHPEQNRAISLREAAILQSFPRNYAFIPHDGPVSLRILGRLIGNAVPVELGRAIARSINSHLANVNMVTVE